MIFLVLFLCVCSILYGSEGIQITCRVGNEQDLPALCALIHTIGMKYPEDSKKVVTFPPKFIMPFTVRDIQKDKIFVAVNGQTGMFIGYKKLFFVPNQAELEQIMKDEIRCMGPESKIVDYADITFGESFFKRTYFTENYPPFNVHQTDLLLYTGADYVEPAYRGKGICDALYRCSLAYLFDSLVNGQLEKYNRLVILYGLSKYNDFDYKKNKNKSRTNSIVRSMIGFLFAKNILLNQPIEHYRFKSFMPKFKEINQNCVPSPDEESVPGFGNVLIFNLNFQ